MLYQHGVAQPRSKALQQAAQEEYEIYLDG